MQKVFVFILVLVVATSCKKVREQSDSGKVVEARFDIEKWPKKVAINSKATEILDKWPEYQAFESSFEGLYDIENSKDLALIIEDLIEKQKELAESGYPEAFDKPHIKSRQVALKTYILKTKGSLEYRLDLQEPIIEMIETFNALRNQFNVILNSTIDVELILDKGE